MVRLRASCTSLDMVSTSSMKTTLNLTPSMDAVDTNSLILQRGLSMVLVTVLTVVSPSSSVSVTVTSRFLVRSEASISRKLPSTLPSKTSLATMSAQEVLPVPGGPARRRCGTLCWDVSGLSLSTAIGWPTIPSRVVGLYFSIQTDSILIGGPCPSTY